jgi:hypothetical protein
MASQTHFIPFFTQVNHITYQLYPHSFDGQDMVKHPINDGHPAVPPLHNALLQPRPGVPRGTNGLLSDVASWLGNPRTKWRWFMGKTSITMRFSNATFDYRRVPAKSEDSSHENSVLALFSLLWRHFRTKISSVQSGRFECFSSVF